MTQASEQIAKQYANAGLNKRTWGNVMYNVAIDGVQGDGSNETTLIQTAINNAIANHIKAVFFPYGTYVASALSNLDQVVLFGDNAILRVGGSSVYIQQLGDYARTGINQNAFINGNIDVWQRGTSFTNVSSTLIYCADRWFFRGGTLSQQATNGSEPFSAKHYARLSYDGVANLTPFIGQNIEDVRTLAGKTVTLSFWAKSSNSITLEHIALIQVFGTGGSTTVTVAQALTIDSATWKKYTLSFALPSISGKTIGTNSYLQLLIRFKQNIAMTVDIAQIQLNAGDVALPFQPRRFAEELALCQRYYRKSYAYDTVPGTGIGASAGSPIFLRGALSSGYHVAYISFPPMRIAPTVSFWDRAGNAGKINTIDASAAQTNDVTPTLVPGEISESSFRMGHNGNIAGIAFHYACDAEL